MQGDKLLSANLTREGRRESVYSELLWFDDDLTEKLLRPSQPGNLLKDGCRWEGGKVLLSIIHFSHYSMPNNEGILELFLTDIVTVM